MFKNFQEEVSRQFERMKKYPMYRTLAEKDELWQTYLGSFPEGTDPKFRERTEHDCQCCKSFIRNVGNAVAVINGKIESIWDIKVEGCYQVVTDALSTLVKSKSIDNIFLHTEPSAGTKENYQKTEKGVITYNHFYVVLSPVHVRKGIEIGSLLSEARSSKDVLLRSLVEITDDSINTVLELIAQGSLYRGEEHKFAVETFKELKTSFNKLDTESKKDIFCWDKSKSTPPSVSRIRNTVIGSLLIDLSEGRDLEYAVTSFESKVAPTNYKRPTTLVTKAMVEKAQKSISELGLTSALERRYANLQDITINNILFVDREAKKVIAGDVFSEIANSVSEKTKNFDKVEEVNIDTFISNILPKAESIEVLLENRHNINLVSLIAPVDASAKEMFKWPNKFSWSYVGELADSIKERVKNAGGKVDGDLRCSLSWFNFDDLDLHMIEPGGYEIYFGNRGSLSPSNGTLDVDMNAGMGRTRNAVENICYSDRARMKDGLYKLQVHNFSKRESVDVGFEVEVEFDGIIHTFAHPKAVVSKNTVTVAEIKYSKKNGFEIVSSIPSSQVVKNLWNIPTQSFHKASVIMMSPNYWDGQNVGNKHYFFMLDGCINEGKARGFFNEFLSEELSAHRKVLEVVGSKMKTDESQNQLSGLGFSSTQHNSLLCRVKGSFSRVVKVIF